MCRSWKKYINNEKEIPENMRAEAEKYHTELIEKIVEQDDKVMNEYFEGKIPDLETLKILMRKGVIANEIFPVFAGSALKNKGIDIFYVGSKKGIEHSIIKSLKIPAL